jgi:hypothetical protein
VALDDVPVQEDDDADDDVALDEHPLRQPRHKRALNNK